MENGIFIIFNLFKWKIYNLQQLSKINHFSIKKSFPVSLNSPSPLLEPKVRFIICHCQPIRIYAYTLKRLRNVETHRNLNLLQKSLLYIYYCKKVLYRLYALFKIKFFLVYKFSDFFSKREKLLSGKFIISTYRGIPAFFDYWNQSSSKIIFVIFL